MKSILRSIGKGKSVFPMKKDAGVEFGSDFRTKSLANNIKKLMDLSDSGKLVREISEQNLFNDRGFIEAWDITSKNQSQVAKYSNMVLNAQQIFELGRILDAKGEFGVENFDMVFGAQLAKSKDINRAESLARLETALDYEFSAASRKLQYLEGQRVSNEFDLSRAGDKVYALSRAKELLESKIIEEGLRPVVESKNLKTFIRNIGGEKQPTALSRPASQKGYSYFYKIKGDLTYKKVDENGKETGVIGINYKNLDRNPIIVKSGRSVRRDNYGNKLRGKYIELKNPIANKRLGTEDTIEGYRMHLVTKNNPLTLVFPETMMGRENFEKSVVDTRSNISH